MVAATQAVVDTPFARDVRDGLLSKPKRVPSKYFYDALGSHLFEAICQLPWYRLTRAEASLLAAHGKAVWRRFDEQPIVIELGCGSGEKMARLLAQRSGDSAAVVHLVDISPTALDLSERTLSRLPSVSVTTHAAVYQDGILAAARARVGSAPLQVLLLGSNIGNFPGRGAVELLSVIREALRPGDGLLLGTDLVKPERDLLLAYADPLGVTRAFNLNLLRRINDELGADFDLAAWEHKVIYNAERMRMESYLWPLRPQRVHIPRAEITVDFDEDDPIWTETSQKYDAKSIAALAHETGFAVDAQWTDTAARFALTQLKAQQPTPRARH